MITNAYFLQSVFNNPNISSFCWITAFKKNPKDEDFKKIYWTGQKIHAKNCPDYLNKNAYFSTALYGKDAKTRSIENAEGVYCIVLDDLGETSIKPTWKLETSQNNYQIGFALKDPITDTDLAKRLLDEISNKSYVNGNDKSGNNLIRYVRLPVGSNNKYGNTFQHQLVEWNEHQRYSVTEIIECLHLDSDFVLNGKSSYKLKDFDSKLDIKELVRQITTSEHYYDPLLKITASFIARGMNRFNVIDMVQGIMEAVPDKPADWIDYYNQIPSMVDGAIKKFAKPLDANSRRFGDVYNGKVFSQMFRGKLLYCHSNKKWLEWDGKFWNFCDANEQDVYGKKAVSRLTDLALEAYRENPNDPDIKNIMNNPKQALSNKKRIDMIQAATTEEGMYIKSIAELDSDIMFLGCANGVVDLKTGGLIDHNPEMLMTKSTNVIFDRQAECPKWETFLDEIFLSDKETIHYLKKALGYSITGDVSEELVHFCVGYGRNGKTLLTNIIYKIVGDYSIVIDTDMLMAHDNQSSSAASPQITRLQGARFAVANEIEDGRRLNDKHLKMLASKQAITAREMYASPIEFMPQHKIWITTNHKPAVSDHTEGFWRRVRPIHFKYTVPIEDVDSKLEDKLLEEKSGILNWLIDGCLMWQKEGLLPSEEIKKASIEYKKESDILGQFLEECCSFEVDAFVAKSHMYSQYKSWCFINTHRCCSKNTFTIRLKEQFGIAETRTSSERRYLGIKLNTLN